MALNFFIFAAIILLVQCRQKRPHVKLSEDDHNELRRLCRHLGAYSRTGPNKGTVSLSTFLRRIARGEFVVTPKGKS